MITAPPNDLRIIPGQKNLNDASDHAPVLSVYAQSLHLDHSSKNDIAGRRDTAQPHLPAMQLTEGNGGPHEIVIHGKNGHKDTISGINPQKGETLPQLIKRLHPNLSEQQLAKEVQHMLKYNKDYGQDLGDGNHLDPSKPVYLSSVKYLDDAGRVTRIEGPTGRVTEIAYDGTGVSAYKITQPNGTISEQASKAGGSWSVVGADGQRQSLAAVLVDPYGDIIATAANGKKIAHLTRGDDILTDYENGKPQSAVTLRHGNVVSQYQYEYTNEKVSCYITYSDSPNQKILLEQQDTRAAIARGEMVKARVENGDVSVDMAPDSYAGRMMQAAQNLIGVHVDDVASGIPRNVGCARMVSEVLVRAGFPKSIVHAHCNNLTDNLKSHGFKQVSVKDMQPGDIIMGGYGVDDNAHTGIYAGNGRIVANSSSRGYFCTDTYDNVFGGFSTQLIWRYGG